MKTNHRLKAKNVVVMRDKHPSQWPNSSDLQGGGTLPSARLCPGHLLHWPQENFQGDFTIQLMSKHGPMQPPYTILNIRTDRSFQCTHSMKLKKQVQHTLSLLQKQLNLREEGTSCYFPTITWQFFFSFCRIISKLSLLLV